MSLGLEGLVLLLVTENILWMQTLKLKILSEKYTFPVGFEPTSHYNRVVHLYMRRMSNLSTTGTLVQTAHRNHI